MRERYVEIVITTPTGLKTLYRGKTTAQAYSVCANNRIGRNETGRRFYKGFPVKIMECISSRRKTLGWFGMEV